MRHFDEIFAIAAERKGGAAAVEALLPQALSEHDLAQVPEDRWLAQFTRSVFQAGFNWSVIDKKWEGFETAFQGFDVGACAFMDDDRFDSLLSDTRIVRNGTKIAEVRDNAAFLLTLRDQGGAGEVLGRWPQDDFVGLLEFLKKEGSRLGGTTAQYALRFLGKDAWVMSRDVVARLVAEGIIDKPPTSKRAQIAVQAAFNTWRDQSGRGLSQISRILAMSV